MADYPYPDPGYEAALPPPPKPAYENNPVLEAFKKRQAAAAGQLEHLDNVEPPTYLNHNITAMRSGDRTTFTNIPKELPGKDIGYSAGVVGSPYPIGGPSVGSLAGGERDFTQRLGATPPVDLQALTQGSMAQDDLLRQEMLKRGQLSQQEVGQAEAAAGTDVASAQEEAAKARAGALTQDPFAETRLKGQMAVDVAKAPGLVARETDEQQLQKYQALRPQAIAELTKANPRFPQLLRVNPQAAEQLIRQKTTELADPLNRAYGNMRITQSTLPGLD